jgi:hypothetical protein
MVVHLISKHLAIIQVWTVINQDLSIDQIMIVYSQHPKSGRVWFLNGLFCPVVKWSSFRMLFKNRTKFVRFLNGSD